MLLKKLKLKKKKFYWKRKINSFENEINRNGRIGKDAENCSVKNEGLH